MDQNFIINGNCPRTADDSYILTNDLRVGTTIGNDFH